MKNSDVLRNIRYAFDFSDDEMISIFSSADLNVTREQVCNWLKRDEDEKFIEINNDEFILFLDGFINTKRGKQDSLKPQIKFPLTNNLILRKLKIALNLKSEDIIEVLDIAGYWLSKHELSAFFRKANHRQYRECKDQILRNLLKGLAIKYRK